MKSNNISKLKTHRSNDVTSRSMER
jgi:hypothetical protein